MEKDYGGLCKGGDGEELDFAGVGHEAGRRWKGKGCEGWEVLDLRSLGWESLAVSSLVVEIGGFRGSLRVRHILSLKGRCR